MTLLNNAGDVESYPHTANALSNSTLEMNIIGRVNYNLLTPPRQIRVRKILPFDCVMYMNIHQCEKKEQSRDTGQTMECMRDRRASGAGARGVVRLFSPVCVMYMNIHQCETKEHSRDTGQTMECMRDRRASGAGARGVLPLFAPVCVMYMNIHQCGKKGTLTGHGANNGMHV